MSTFNAETAENLEDIEKQFAVKAVQQVETYWLLLEKIPGLKLKFTPHDDDIYLAVRELFPEFKDPEYLKNIKEEDLKSPAGKAKWREFLQPFENLIDDYNFGTILRLRSNEEYTQDGTIFVVRLQFYAVEICRNRAGLNDWACRK